MDILESMSNRIALLEDKISKLDRKLMLYQYFFEYTSDSIYLEGHERDLALDTLLNELAKLDFKE